MIAPLVAPERRSTAFGLFDTCFGAAWMAGSILFGLLYQSSLAAQVTISLVGQLASMPFFVVGNARKFDT